jgi:hypothetical protein
MPQPNRMDGDTYLAVMQELGLDHRGMAASLGVSRWCSIAWRNGRRNIPPIAEVAIRGLLLERYAGDLATRAVSNRLDQLSSEAAPSRNIRMA